MHVPHLGEDLHSYLDSLSKDSSASYLEPAVVTEHVRCLHKVLNTLQSPG